MQFIIEYESSTGNIRRSVAGPNGGPIPPEWVEEWTLMFGDALAIVEGPTVESVFGTDDIESSRYNPVTKKCSKYIEPVQRQAALEAQASVRGAQRQKVQEFKALTAAAFNALPDSQKLQKLFEAFQALASQVETQ